MKLQDKILEEKIFLSEQCLVVAKEALDDIQALTKSGEVGVRDLVSVFNSTVKIHRDLVNDIRDLHESKIGSEEESLKEKSYRSKVDELVSNLKRK